MTVIQSDDLIAVQPGDGSLPIVPAQHRPNFISDLDIIILNYNTVDLLRACLESVFASQCNFRWRVFVVDNGSHDKSTEMVRAEFEPLHDNLTLIASPVNGGYAFGNNLALRLICPLPPKADPANLSPAEQVERKLLHVGSQPQARYILLLNPDSIVPPDAFQVVYDYAEAHPLVGVVGPKLVKANGELDLACRRSFPTPEVSLYRMLGLSKLFPQSRRFGRYNLTYLDVNKTAEVDSVVGAFMLLRAEVIHQAGILDEAYFMYGEDLDWAYRIKSRGWKIIYYPATTVLHLKGESSKKRSYGALINFYQAMIVFYRKHYARQTFFLLNWLIYLGILGKGSLALLQNVLRPGARKRVS